MSHDGHDGLTPEQLIRAFRIMHTARRLDDREVALKRQSYGIKPITDGVINDQQQVADTFFSLGLIPKQIKISDVARRSGS